MILPTHVNSFQGGLHFAAGAGLRLCGHKNATLRERKLFDLMKYVI